MVKGLIMLMVMIMIEILDCHSSHRATQSGQAKSCHKSDCLMITFQFGNSGDPNFGNGDRNFGTYLPGDPNFGNSKPGNLPARQPAPQQSCARQAGLDMREALRALRPRTAGSGTPSKVSN